MDNRPRTDIDQNLIQNLYQLNQVRLSMKKNFQINIKAYIPVRLKRCSLEFSKRIKSINK